MSLGHEPNQVDAPALHKLGGLFVVLLALILCAMYVLWRHVHADTLSMAPPAIPPSPRLQVAAPVDRAAQYRLQAQQRDTYGWTDPQHRTAHIPVARAMAMLAAESSPRHGGKTSP